MYGEGPKLPLLVTGREDVRASFGGPFDKRRTQTLNWVTVMIMKRRRRRGLEAQFPSEAAT